MSKNRNLSRVASAQPGHMHADSATFTDTVTASAFIGSGASLTGVHDSVAVQAQIDSAAVTLTGDQTIAGEKTFSDNLSVTKTTPVLDILADANDSASLRLRESAVGIVGAEFTYNGADNKLYLKCGNNTDSIRMTVQRDDGNVGIGTDDPSAKLTVDEGDYLKFVIRDTSGGDVPLSVGSGTNAITISNDSTGTNTREYLKFNRSNQTVNFGTSGTERMRIEDDGDVRIGYYSSSGSAGSLLDLTFINTNNTGHNAINFQSDNSAGRCFINYERGSSSVRGDLIFGTSNTETARITWDGKLLVGALSGGLGKVCGFGGSAQAGFFEGDGTTEIINISKTGTAGNYTSIRFLNNNFATVVGSISHTTSATAYNTSSDKRLKENIVDAPAGNIDAIRVRSFDWKSDGSHQTYGMVAQELVDVAPEAVSQGQTEDDMWGVDYSKLVPMMIKEIQDLKSEVAALKSALESN